MRPRWTRSDPTARTDRLAVVPASAGTRPRTLRLPLVRARRGPGDPRTMEVALALEESLDHGAAVHTVALHIRRTSVLTYLDGAAIAEVRAAIAASLAALREPHRRYELHRYVDCARCTPTELCPWHYARLRSWWDARDAAATRLVAAVDTALAGSPLGAPR